MFADKTCLTLLHIHKKIEIIYITDGEALVYLDGKEYHAGKGEVLFVSLWQPHRIDVLPGRFGYICICFDSFSRKFKNCFGTTFGKYLCAFRLERAKQILEEADASVTKEGSHTGFTCISYFIMKYNQIYGVAPKQSIKKEKPV